MSNLFNKSIDPRNTSQQDLFGDSNKYDRDFVDDESHGHPKYQDEDITEEEIKLFASLAEREVE